MTLRKIARIGACLTLLLTLAPAASASTALPPPAERYATQQTGPCTDENKNNYHLGMVEDAGVVSFKGVQGYINPLETTFRPCSHGGIVGPATHDGVFAWIGVEPSPNSGNSSGILQLGVGRCKEFNNSFCDGSLHFFLGRSGCGFGGHITDLGPANYNEHFYRLYTPNYIDWYAYIDGHLEFTIEDAATSSDRLQCWIDEDTRIEWAAETWDGGDGLADSTDKLNIQGAAGYWSSSIGWSGFGWNAASSCDYSEDSDQLDYKCDIVNNQDLAFWSTRW